MARELDPITGLYYVRNRWYDPVLGRFVSEDPIGLAGGINVYVYSGNSPTNLRDPSGLAPNEECIEWYRVTYQRSTGEVVSEEYLGRTCPGGFQPADRPLTASERDRLQCIADDWLSRQARRIFSPMLNSGLVAVGSRQPPAQAWTDVFHEPTIIVFSYDRHYGSTIAGHNDRTLARIVAHEVGHVEQTHRIGINAQRAWLAISDNNPFIPFRAMAKADAARYEYLHGEYRSSLGGQACPPAFAP